MCVKVIASQRWDVFLRHGVYIYTVSPKKGTNYFLSATSSNINGF